MTSSPDKRSAPEAVRFETTGLGKNLNHLLDTIHRALALPSESSTSPPAGIL